MWQAQFQLLLSQMYNFTLHSTEKSSNLIPKLTSACTCHVCVCVCVRVCVCVCAERVCQHACMHACVHVTWQDFYHPQIGCTISHATPQRQVQFYKKAEKQNKTTQEAEVRCQSSRLWNFTCHSMETSSILQLKPKTNKKETQEAEMR